MFMMMMILGLVGCGEEEAEYSYINETTGVPACIAAAEVYQECFVNQGGVSDTTDYSYACSSYKNIEETPEETAMWDMYFHCIEYAVTTGCTDIPDAVVSDAGCRDIAWDYLPYWF